MHQINFEKFGQGSPLIIIHGLFGTLDNLKTVARQLSDEFTVYLVDLPAHGDSSTPSPLTLGTMAEALSAFIATENIQSPAILGHSLGGKVAMELALTSPSLISKLIVADIAPVQYPRRHDQIINGLKSVDLSASNRQEADAQLAKSISAPGVRAFLMKSFARSDIGWRWKFDLDALSAAYDELVAGNKEGSYSQPTLFLIGGNSDYVTLKHKNEITARFSHVTSKVIQGTGHWLHAEKPAAFVKICRDFLAQ